MKRVKRLWMKAMDQGIDDRFVRFLVQLRVVNKEQFVEYRKETHPVLMRYQQEQWEKRARSESRVSSHTFERAPRNIKPTKARKGFR